MNYLVTLRTRNYDREIQAASFEDALAIAIENKAPGVHAQILGPSYDYDEGRFLCNDGLTEEQREMVEEAGL